MILQHVGKGEFENDTVPIAGQAPKRHPTFAPAKFSRRFESTLPQHRLPSGWSWELPPGLWCQFYILNSEREFMIHDEIQLSNNIKKYFSRFLSVPWPLAAELMSIMPCNVTISQIYGKKRMQFSRHPFWVLTLTE